MKLPKIEHPLLTTTVPVAQRDIRYRLMTVKEEKMLLLAKESEDIEQAVLSIQQVLTNCVQDDIEDLSLTDVEFLLLKIRSGSINNVIEFAINDPETEERVELEVDLNDVKVRHHETHNPKVRISEDVMVVMRYPSIEDYPLMVEAVKSQQAQLKLLITCMDTVASGDEIYKLEDFTKEDIEEFFDQFTEDNMNDLAQFFETIPTVYFEVPYMNSNGEQKTFVIEGLENFTT